MTGSAGRSWSGASNVVRARGRSIEARYSIFGRVSIYLSVVTG